ncbi:DHA2 family efflux MFS transporter permease subunit [Saccharopolyspora hattusasensis]|uniref:DHA2 family efflux MFS transporter permease subunit n=1 Tax=Saccharopolyspora hattusasensis TaxID=1128679 RepID=UPI003D956CE1
MAASAASRRWLGLIALCLGVALIVVDTTIVNVIVPPLISDLKIDSVQVQWVQESYPIVLAALLLLTGRLADLYGARAVFLTGTAAFTATSVLAALAPAGGILILARILQGAAAAMMLPTSLALVNTTFTGADRGRAFAVWGSTIGVAAAVGPLLGGALAEFSWRWAFAINIVIGFLIIVGVRAFLSSSPRSAGRVDFTDAALSVLGFGLLAFALIEGRNYGWITVEEPLNILGIQWSGGPSPVLVALVVAAVALATFVRRQSALIRRGDEPLMDVRLFSINSFRNGIITVLIIGLGEFGIVAVLPLWMQFALGYSPLQAGLALVPLAAGTFVASVVSLGIAAKVLPLRLVRTGLVLEIAGLVGLGFVAAPDTSWWSISVALFVFGVGTGFATAQIANVILAEVPAPSAGRGAAINGTAGQVGSALGIAVLTTAFFSALGFAMHHRLDAIGVQGETADRVTDTVTSSAGSAIASLNADPATAALAHTARAAMADSVSVVGYLAAGLLVIGLIATALISSGQPEHVPEPVAGEERQSGRN